MTSNVLCIRESLAVDKNTGQKENSKENKNTKTDVLEVARKKMCIQRKINLPRALVIEKTKVRVSVAILCSNII